MLRNRPRSNRRDCRLDRPVAITNRAVFWLVSSRKNRASRPLFSDRECSDLVPFEREEEAQANGATWEGAGYQARHDGLAFLLGDVERFEGEVVLGVGFFDPAANLPDAPMREALVDHDRVGLEAGRDCLDVVSVALLDICGDRRV